ncbi:KHG/KDPG aldolase, partial [Hondaea fermentalgiana]
AAPGPVVKATLNALRKARVVTVIRAVDSDAALERACDLVKNCGCRAIEITRDSHAWLDVLRGIVEKVGDQAVVGVGTILSAEDVHAAAANGAKFALSPVNPPGFVSACLDANVLAVPGCFTPQEVFNAIADGASLIKIFPAQNFGVTSLRALRSISHFRAVCFLATGGIDEAGAHEWFDAGCAVVGMGALICGRDLGTQDPRRAAELRQAYLADGGGRSIAQGILERLKLTDA